MNESRPRRGLVAIAVIAITVITLYSYPSLFFAQTPLMGPGNKLDLGTFPGTELVSIGKEGPKFEVTTIEGTVFRLEDQKGKIVLLDFVATWCIPCAQQMPHLMKVYDEYSGKGLVMLTIDADPKEKNKELKIFRDTYEAKWSFALGSEVAIKYQVNYIPTIFIIDRGGLVAYRHVGLIGAESIRAELEKVR